MKRVRLAMLAAGWFFTMYQGFPNLSGYDVRAVAASQYGPFASLKACIRIRQQYQPPTVHEFPATTETSCCYSSAGEQSCNAESQEDAHDGGAD
jgi:hypothetical protein